MTVLHQIVIERTKDVRAERRSVEVEMLQAMLDERNERRSLVAALRGDAPAIVAEIKRASPSAGMMDLERPASSIASSYAHGGAAAISVVVEPRWFAGRYADLSAVRSSVALPVLCKDFVVNDFQVLKAAAFGADAILLIAAILDDERLRDCIQWARTFSLEAVVEVHGEQELGRALAAGPEIIGINNRDLASLTVDTGVAQRLSGLVPSGRTVLAESGYAKAMDLARAMTAGISAFLIGEALMRSSDPAAAIKKLREVHAWSG